MSLRDVLIALAIIVVWGVNFVTISWGVQEVPPLLLSALRYVFAALPAVFFIAPPRVGLGLIVAYGLTGGVVQFGLLFSAIKLGMPVGLSSLVMQLQAFFTIGLAVLFLRERPGPAQIAGAVVALAGIGVIALERMGAATALVPLLMTIAAAFWWAAANIFTKRAGQIDMMAFVIWSALVPPIPLFLLSLLIEGPGAAGLALSQITWLGFGSLLFMAYGATVFGYGMWSVLLSRYPANVVAPFTLLVPIAGMASAALLLGEGVSVLEIAGSALVLAGLLLNVFGQRVLAAFRRV